MSYPVYLLYSNRLDVYYTGYTGQQMEERRYMHRVRHRGFTGKAKDWEVVYTEEYEDKGAARARERQIKSWKSRVLLERLIREKQNRKKD